MKVFLEGGLGNGEYIDARFDNPFLQEQYKLVIPDGSCNKIEYEMARPFRLRHGAVVYVEAQIELPQSRLDILND